MPIDNIKMDVKISIVVAVYNGESIIEKTLKSISEQTFSDYEVIIVDDGSNDNTQQIVERFCNNDNRFKLFNKPNGGVASARNIGIGKATGEYIIHHDDDDFMPDNALQNLYSKAIESNSDIVIADYNVVRDSKVSRVSIKPTDNDYMYYINELLEGKLHGSLWNKLIKKSLYGDTTFEDGIDYMEDKLLLLRLLYKMPKVEYLPKVVYNYVQNENSLSGNFSKRSYECMYKMIKCLESDLNKNNIIFDLTEIKLEFKLKGILNFEDNNGSMLFPEVDDKIFSSKKMKFPLKLLLFFNIKNFTFATNMMKSAALFIKKNRLFVTLLF